MVLENKSKGVSSTDDTNAVSTPVPVGNFGFETTTQRVGEGTPYAATITCDPIGDEETGSLWEGSLLFDDNRFNLKTVLNSSQQSPLVFYHRWWFVHHKSGGAHLMNLMMRFHEQFVEMFEGLLGTPVLASLIAPTQKDVSS